MRATNHKNVGLCWNSNPTDVVEGSVKSSFDLLRPWLRSCHINELPGPYPYKELFGLMKKTGYDRWTLCECAESKEPERFLKYYRALWRELMSSHRSTFGPSPSWGCLRRPVCFALWLEMRPIAGLGDSCRALFFAAARNPLPCVYNECLSPLLRNAPCPANFSSSVRMGR